MTPADASWRLLSLLWQASWQGALFAGAVAFICFAFRAPAPYRAALWLLAGVKFLGGFLWLLFVGRAVPLKIPLPAPMTPSVQTQSAWDSRVDSVTLGMAAVWFVGAVLCVLMVIYRAYTTNRTLACAKPLADSSVTKLLAHLCVRIGVSPRATPSVRVAPREDDGPQVTLSGDRCVVVLPETLLPPSPAALSEGDLRFVLAHELAHIRRGDLWAGLLFAAVQILFFFHPGAVWVRREWEVAREEACDLMALRACAQGDRDTAAKYGALLLRLGTGAAPGSAASANIAASPFAALRRRLNHLNSYQTSHRSRAARFAVLSSLPVLFALILPLEFRWSTPQPRGARTTSITKRLIPFQKQVVSGNTVPSQTIRPRRVLPRYVATVKPALRVVQTAARRDEPFLAPLVAVATPTPTRTSPTLVAPKSAASQDVKAPLPVLSEPVLVANDTEVASTAIAPTAPSLPLPVMPDVASVSDNRQALSVVPGGDDSTGDVSDPRYPDASTARASGIATDVKGTPRTGFSIPGFESGRPLTKPILLPSPSPTPPSNEDPLRVHDTPRPSQH